MSQICQIQCGLPFCQRAGYEQTNASIALRVSALALGALAVTAGALMLTGVPVISQLGMTAGWATLSAGLAIALVGASLKCAKSVQESLPVDENTLPCDRLPEWLRKYVQADVPRIKDELSFSFLGASQYVDLTKSGPPITFIYGNGSLVGLLLRLRVEKMGSTEAPFSVIFFAHSPTPLLQTSEWRHRVLFFTENNELKQDLLQANNIFGDTSYFSYNLASLKPKTEKELLTIETQDSLSKLIKKGKGIVYPWFLLRLLNGKSVRLRESAVNRYGFAEPHDFKKKATDYWKISLETE